MASLDLLQSLIAIPAPPGQEERLASHVAGLLGPGAQIDAKGNVRAGSHGPRIVVTAHLDEIALMVSGVHTDGTLSVAPLGGVHPWKWGETPVVILGSRDITGVLGFGGIHTSHPSSAAAKAREGKAVQWGDASVLTGMDPHELAAAGVRLGTRVCLHPSRRGLAQLEGGLVAGPFLDDRADLAALILAARKGIPEGVMFAATASEEVGGEGAQWLLNRLQPEACIALEIGPIVPDAPAALTPDPSVWVADSFAASSPRDLDTVERAARRAGLRVQWQIFSRGGSDASIAASRGLCARSFTLAFAAENSHGLEVMHKDAPEALSRLLSALLEELA